MMLMYCNYIQHKNDWWWGKTTTLIHKDGIATVELQFDNNYPTVAFIKGLSVFDLYRKKGYGKQMLRLCEDIAKKEGKLFLQLSVDKDCEWLVNWYKREYFDIIYVDEHEYTMWKKLK